MQVTTVSHAALLAARKIQVSIIGKAVVSLVHGIMRKQRIFTAQTGTRAR